MASIMEGVLLYSFVLQEMHSLNKAHKEEIKKLMQQIHSHSDNTFSKLKQAALVCAAYDIICDDVITYRML